MASNSRVSSVRLRACLLAALLLRFGGVERPCLSLVNGQRGRSSTHSCS